MPSSTTTPSTRPASSGSGRTPAARRKCQACATWRGSTPSARATCSQSSAARAGLRRASTNALHGNSSASSSGGHWSTGTSPNSVSITVPAVLVLSVVGNRPQFIKSGPLSLALRDAAIDEVVLHTGQHWDTEMSAVFFEELELPEPAYRLDLHTADPAAMRPRIADAVAAEQPDWVLVFGDTNSTLAGAEAAGDVPVAHVEAGLRSFD